MTVQESTINIVDNSKEVLSSSSEVRNFPLICHFTMKTVMEIDPFWKNELFTLTGVPGCPLMYQKCPMAVLYSPLKYWYANPTLTFFPVDICGPRKTNLGPIEVATTFSHQAQSKALVSLVKSSFETPYNGGTKIYGCWRRQRSKSCGHANMMATY